MADTMEVSSGQTKTRIEDLNREELIQKYKGLLSIAKKAKQAKDDLAEENRKLKELLLQSETQKDADKKALMTMKETLEQFTEQKLKLTSEFSDLEKKNKKNDETLSNLNIENESLKRQLERLNENNEALLKDIDRMENQLEQVNILGMEQKKHLGLLELKVTKLKEAENLNCALQSTVYVTQEENKILKEQDKNARQAFEELKRKYNQVRELNTEQRHKFNSLKDRFVDVHRKLKNLKECKRVLLETQHEYAEAVSKWQNEIVEASKLLFIQMNQLQKENEDLRHQQLRESTESVHVETELNIMDLAKKIQEIHKLCAHVRDDLEQKDALLTRTLQQNEQLQKTVNALNEEKRTGIASSKEVYEYRLRGGEADITKTPSGYNELLERVNILEVERNDLKERCSVVEQLRTENRRLQNQIADLLSKLKQTSQENDDLQQIRDLLKTMEQEKVTLLEQIRKQECEQQRSEEDYKTMEQKYIEQRKRYMQMKQENVDLLGEMCELNEALKARGDVISRQQEKHQQLMNELGITNAKLKQIDDVLLQKDAAIAEKEAQVREINKEIDLTRQETHSLEVVSTRTEEQLRALNEELQKLRTNAGGADTQSDILSTSTISRTEEITRLREVEDSFEDKYNKLRCLAIKLKRKVQEQTAQLSEMEQQQTRYIAMKIELEELRSNFEEVNREHQHLIATLKTENLKLKTSRKQANVLNLEIDAAEKTLLEATTKLTAKTNELEKVKEQLFSKEHTITQLRKEISIVESEKKSETEHAKDLKGQIDNLQVQLNDAIYAKQLGKKANKQLEVAQDRLKQELEQIRLENSHRSAESLALRLEAQSERDELQQRLAGTEVELREAQIKLNSVTCALENLRSEHTEYKQKAQAVLRKHQGTDSTREKELMEELTQLRFAEEQQRQMCATQTQKLESLKQQNADLYLDNENLQRRIRDQEALLDNLRQQNDSLLQEQRIQLQAHQEAVRKQRQQLEMLQDCHSKKMIELETKYRRQIELLDAGEKLQIKSVPMTVRMPPIIGAASIQTIQSSSIIQSPPYGERSQSEILLMLSEREDAEGSEEANNNTTNKNSATSSAAVDDSNQQVLRKILNNSRRSHHEFMPLDELLNAPMHAFQTDMVTTSISGNSFGRQDSSVCDLNVAVGDNSTDNMHVELDATRKLLAKQESRVRHLTTLLAENEQDLAKLTQMNDMLKEEMRRQERAVEREKHMHNAEYLKNVVLKFLTLTSGDERVCLVPVLNTILKLSRNETEILNCVAKGQKLPTESQGRGWSSFLPIFGGGGSSNN